VIRKEYFIISRKSEKRKKHIDFSVEENTERAGYPFRPKKNREKLSSNRVSMPGKKASGRDCRGALLERK